MRIIFLIVAFLISFVANAEVVIDERDLLGTWNLQTLRVSLFLVIMLIH